jgi:AraC-like DNA-binding protein
VVVTLGGRETCRPDYVIARRAYAYHGIEYVAEGAGWVVLDGVRQELQAGTVFGYAPDTPCEIHTDPRRPLVKYFICFAGRGAAARLRAAGVGGARVNRLEAHAEVRSVAEDLIREGRRTTPQARAICQTLFELLLLRIEEAARPASRGVDPSRDTFLRCKALIDAHAERLGTLEQIAARAGLEASSVCRLFRRFQGTSPYQYLLRRKMTLAAEHLIEHGGLVKEAAERVGYDDPYHFSRNFKAVHGISPRALLLRRRTDA